MSGPAWTMQDPEVIAPILEACIRLAEDRSEGESARNDAFLWHRLRVQRALGEYVRLGGQLP